MVRVAVDSVCLSGCIGVLAFVRGGSDRISNDIVIRDSVFDLTQCTCSLIV